MTRLLAALLLITLLVISGAAPALADPNDGSVTGQVVNKTAGGGSPDGTTVLLIAFGRKEQRPLSQKTTQADADGRYSFDGLDRDPNMAYITVARYQNVNYPTDQPFLLQNTQTQQADINIYDATNADDAIQFERLNLLVLGADQGIVQFMEMGALVNTGDRTFVTANPQDQQLARALKLSLPNGALSVQMQTGFNDDEVIPGIGGVQITTPIPPGRHEFAMSFQVPYQGSSADVSMQLPYPTASYSVYLPDTGLKLDAGGLAPGGSTQMGGQSYSLYSASNVGKSTMMSAQLSGLGSNGATGPTQLALISLGVVLFVLGGGVLLFGSRVRGAAATPPAARAAVDTEQERLELVVKLAVLDERFAAGDISEADYEVERDRGKQRLRELTLARHTTAPTPTPTPTPTLDGRVHRGVSAISARGLTARYAGQPAAAPALRSIDLAVEPGERLLLLGPNGAGKSTFIRVFAGLMRPARGEALVLGSPPPQARRVMGVVSHATSLYDELTAEENLRFFGDLYGVPDARARAAELLERVGLPQLANERVGRLSRGQQQRVTIARALLHNPPVLLLDEPDTGLDMGAFGLLEQLVADRTVIMTTHNLANGLRLGTRAVVLAHGRLVHAQAALTDADAPALGEILARLGRLPDTL